MKGVVILLFITFFSARCDDFWESCGPCYIPDCSDKSFDCHILCDTDVCPDGYSTQLMNETRTVCHPFDTNNTNNYTKPESFKPVTSCQKCRVQKCVECSSEDYMYNCTRCADDAVLNVTKVKVTSRDGNGTEVEQMIDASVCVFPPTTPDTREEEKEEDDGGGSSVKAEMIGAGVASAAVVLFGGVGVAIYISRRRNRNRHRDENKVLGLNKYRKKKSKGDTQQEESPEQRYVSTPTSSMRHHDLIVRDEMSEVRELGDAPALPQDGETYDSLSQGGRKSGHVYAEQMFTTESTYGNMSSIKSNDNNAPSGNPTRVYGNVPVVSELPSTGVPDEPSEIYGNDIIVNNHVEAQQPGNDTYMDMTGGSAPSSNDRGLATANLTENIGQQDGADDVYTNEQADDVYLNEAPGAGQVREGEGVMDDVYLNEGVGAEEENWYGNT